MRTKSLLALLAIESAMILAGCQKKNDSLYSNFQTPPQEVMPRVWWHWMDGNVTKDGIAKDLEWMHSSHIAGFMNFYAGMASPQIVPERMEFLSEEWKDAFSYTTKLAASYGMEVSIACSPGWSFTGGPWVEPKDAMKKLTWRETTVSGGKLLDIDLPEPYKTIGTFQNISGQDDGFGNTNGEGNITDGYYEDIAVLAVKLPEEDFELASLHPTITSSGGNFNLAQLTDGDLAVSQALPPSPSGQAWIQYSFNEPVTVKAVTWVDGQVRGQWGAPTQVINKYLKTSGDGINFTEVCPLPNSSAAQGTISFDPQTARYFRIYFDNYIYYNPYASVMGWDAAGIARPIQVAELVLHPVTRINHAEEKAGFAAPADLSLAKTPAEEAAVPLDDIIDISENVTDGHLNWDAPEGRWRILRFGYSQTGKKNSPAPADATGYEIDKMDPDAVQRYFDHYLGMYKEVSGEQWGKTLRYLMADSYESGQENWTPAMFEEFEKRNGYSLLPWLPVITGQIVGSSEESELFLRDWRRTLGKLVSENLYDKLSEILRPYGMGRYTESHENGRVYLTDGMDVKRNASVPMSAEWIPNDVGGSTLSMARADIRESASVAHIYGQNIVAAESLTTPMGEDRSFAFYPARLKPIADDEMANGLNRFVIHTSVHQPSDEHTPRRGLGPVGQWFTRHETWAGSAWAWMDYLGRSCYMLQQGNFVADILYYYGDDNNITGLFGASLPEIPAGYNFDFVNTDALTRLASTKNGKIQTESGMSYKVLALDENCSQMSLPALRKIAELVRSGVVFCGNAPVGTGSLADDKAEFDALVSDIWSGKYSNVIAGGNLKAALAETSADVMSVAGDSRTATFENGRGTGEVSTKGAGCVAGNESLRYIHRSLKDAEIYWVKNSVEAQDVELSFRVSGLKPEIWHPEDARREDASYKIADGRTTVRLSLTDDDAVFVVFRGKAKENEVTLPDVEKTPVQTIEGPWQLAFQAGRGAPESLEMETLADLSSCEDFGVRHFSGEVTYSTEFEYTGSSEKRIILNMGKVAEMAEVTLNGKNLGIVWKKPFEIDITEALAEGRNSLQIKVTNTWANRLIGDAKVPENERISWTAYPSVYSPDTALRASGLIGPVSLEVSSR